MKKIICFGEVLWDMLPTGRKLGGAPLNVALRMQSLGLNASMISAIGQDTTGQELLHELKAHKAQLKHIQYSKNYNTSEVLVHLDSKGSASYEIKMPCAWDDIAYRINDAQAVAQADAFIYGSLVARSNNSRNTLLKLLPYAQYCVFDVNLRPPHYKLDTLALLMQQANLIKFNKEELVEICQKMGHNSTSLESNILFIAQQNNSPQICVTHGGEGAMLFQDGHMYYNTGYKVEVADTVGAGDSFLATLVSKLLTGTPPQEALNTASAMGALVASKSGANPTIEPAELKKIMLFA